VFLRVLGSPWDITTATTVITDIRTSAPALAVQVLAHRASLRQCIVPLIAFWTPLIALVLNTPIAFSALLLPLCRPRRLREAHARSHVDTCSHDFPCVRMVYRPVHEAAVFSAVCRVLNGVV
jgi:hypothetical protein